MLADPHEIERGGVESVAVGLEQRAITVTIVGELGVAVRVAAIDAIRLPAGLDGVIPDLLQVGLFVGVSRIGVVAAVFAFQEDRRFGRPGKSREPAGVDIGPLEKVLIGVAVVGRPSGDQGAIGVPG